MQIFSFLNLIPGLVMGTKSLSAIEGDPGTIAGIPFIIAPILGYALLLVAALIAENVISIKKKIENYIKNTD